jgi:hypothetical protein
MKRRIILFLVIYAVSALQAWYYFHLKYSDERGRWHEYDPRALDVFITVCPVINTISVVGWAIEFPLYTDIGFGNRFFNRN